MSVKHSYPSDSLAIIVLAAGRSSRLGQMKQLITVNDKSLVELQLERALKVSSKVYCVLGFNARQVHARIDHLPINTIINSKWSDGMASSIAAGIKALTPDIKAVMIVLVDQWQLTSTDLIYHHSYWQGDARAIVVAQTACDLATGVNENLGPPVLFPQDYFSELAELVGEQGAKPLLKKYQKRLVKAPLAQAFFDIDTPEQLAQMKIELSAR